MDGVLMDFITIGLGLVITAAIILYISLVIIALATIANIFEEYVHGDSGMGRLWPLIPSLVVMLVVHGVTFIAIGMVV